MHVHAGLEKKLVSQIKKINTIAGYVQLLRLMYGFYHPLQLLLEPHLHASHSSTPARGRQSHKLLDDIAALSPGHEHHIPLCENLPAVTTPSESLGALYVTEGSTLGGRIITKMISNQLNISVSTGFSFFNAYGASTGIMWEKFREMLNEPRDRNEQEKVMDTARNTFLSFNHWITANERAQ